VRDLARARRCRDHGQPGADRSCVRRCCQLPSTCVARVPEGNTREPKRGARTCDECLLGRVQGAEFSAELMPGGSHGISPSFIRGTPTPPGMLIAQWARSFSQTSPDSRHSLGHQVPHRADAEVFGKMPGARSTAIPATLHSPRQVSRAGCPCRPCGHVPGKRGWSAYAVPAAQAAQAARPNPNRTRADRRTE
jgi:hypothetical protein